MRQTTGRRGSQGAAANARGRTARRRARVRNRRRRRWRLGAAVVLTFVVGVTAYFLASSGSGVRPALAQALLGMRPPPRLLTEAEVETGLVHRLEAMRQRQEYLVERAAQRQAAAGERRSATAERRPLPRDPEPVPGEESSGAPE